MSVKRCPLIRRTSPGRKADGRKQREGNHSLTDCSHLSGGRLASRVAEISIGQSTRRHAHKGSEDVIAETNASQSEGIIHQIEREKRHQPDERDETPAFLLNPAHQPTEPFAAARRNPIRGDISRDHEGERSAQGRASKIPQGSPDGAEEAPPARVSTAPGTNGTVAEAYSRTNRIGADAPNRAVPVQAPPPEELHDADRAIRSLQAAPPPEPHER